MRNNIDRQQIRYCLMTAGEMQPTARLVPWLHHAAPSRLPDLWPAGRHASVRVHWAGSGGRLGPAGAAVWVEAGVALFGADDDLRSRGEGSMRRWEPARDGAEKRKKARGSRAGGWESSVAGSGCRGPGQHPGSLRLQHTMLHAGSVRCGQGQAGPCVAAAEPGRAAQRRKVPQAPRLPLTTGLAM